MNSQLLLAFLIIPSCACTNGVIADEGEKRNPKPDSIEVSGRLHRPVKWTPQLELIPAGQIKRIDLQGQLLNDIKEGEFLHVRGVVHSRLHRGGTKENPSPFGAQWIIWLEVRELKMLDHPLDVLKKDDK